MDNKNSLKEKILKEIKSGKVKMKPKFHFVLRAGLWILGIIMTFAAALYLISFAFFVLARSGMFHLPRFGFRGVMAFLFDFPWFLVFAALVFIVLVEILVKHYAFAYRRPLLYSVLGVVGLVLVLGFIVRATSFHDGLFRRADRGGLPLFGALYRGFRGEKFHSVHPGVVAEPKEGRFTLELRDGRKLLVVFDPDTKVPDGGLKSDDLVVVFGEEIGGTIRAFGVRRVDDLEDFLSHPPERMVGRGFMVPK